MTAVDYSSDQIISAIGAALKAEDMPAVAGLLRMLAVKDPTSAETLLAAIDLISDVQSPMSNYRQLSAEVAGNAGSSAAGDQP